LKADPVFIKLGGSLITDKTRAETPRPAIITRLAGEVRRAIEVWPQLTLLLGHGSGSFGHWLASRYGTRDGVGDREGWIGYGEVAATAARLNRIVADAFLDAGVPVLTLQPSASARCRDGVLVDLNTWPVRRALDEQLVPLVYGDVALDEVRGGTIISTEEIMVFLADELRPRRILLLGETAGVFGPAGEVIPRITPDDIEAVAGSLGGSRGVDVTGGMVSKVRQMLELVQGVPGLQVHVLSGMEPGLLTRALLEDGLEVGTRIVAFPRAHAGD
jgi:isopentenyl phosphate kinase